MKALKISVGGNEVVDIHSFEVVEFDSGDDLRAQLDGGTLEGLQFCRDAFAYIDERGKNKGLPYNAVATELCAHILGPGDFISGTMIVVGLPDENGGETDCPDHICDLFCGNAV